MYTVLRPNLSHLHVFGSFVTSKNPGDRRTKLSTNVSHSIFLGYTATDRNIFFRDKVSNQIKQAQHVVFDEVHCHRKKRSPYATQFYDFDHKITNNAQTTPPQPIIDPSYPPMYIVRVH